MERAGNVVRDELQREPDEEVEARRLRVEVPEALREVMLKQPDVEELPVDRHQRDVEADAQCDEGRAADDERSRDDRESESAPGHVGDRTTRVPGPLPIRHVRWSYWPP